MLLQLKVITPEEADSRWQSDGWVFVDVQTEVDFEKCHAIGSVNIPLFTPISGNSIMQLGVRATTAWQPVLFFELLRRALDRAPAYPPRSADSRLR